jgi:hypothetical protein
MVGTLSDEEKEDDLGVSGGVRGVWSLAEIGAMRVGDGDGPYIGGENTGAFGLIDSVGFFDWFALDRLSKELNFNSYSLTTSCNSSTTP